MDYLLEFFIYMPNAVIYAFAFLILLACGLGMPIPEDITLFTMGLIAYYGLTDFKMSVLVCLAGVLIGDCMIFWFGRKYGLRLAQKGFLAKALPAARLEKVRSLFLKYGNKLIFAARFMPGLRAPTYFSAGTLQLPFSVFVFYDGLASLLSVPLLVFITFKFGGHVEKVIGIARNVQNGIAAIILIVVAMIIYKARKKSKRSEDTHHLKDSSIEKHTETGS